MFIEVTPTNYKPNVLSKPVLVNVAQIVTVTAHQGGTKLVLEREWLATIHTVDEISQMLRHAVVDDELRRQSVRP